MSGKADIAFLQVDGKPYCDIRLEDNDILRDRTIESAVNIMIGTDRRVTLEELRKSGLDLTFPYNLRGWWGDTYRDRKIGSKLWLNKRKKTNSNTLRTHRRYIKEALQPLITNGIAKSINIHAEWGTGEQLGHMLCAIDITRTDDSVTQTTFVLLWEEVLNASY